MCECKIHECMKIDYLNDASRMKLTKLIPGIGMYFGDSIECYEGLYEKIDEYLSDIECNINSVSEKIAMIRKLMYTDQQNEMTNQMCELNVMLCKMYC